MSEAEFNRDELLNLIEEVLEGNPSEASREELQEILMNSREARDLYRGYTEMHAHLSFDYTGGLGQEDMPGDRRERVLKHSRSFRWAIAAAVAATLFAGVLYFVRPVAEPALFFADGGVAVLSRSLDVEWGSSSETYHVGDPIKEGLINVKSGLIEIEFLSGASVIVEGPAELELVDDNSAVFHAGNLRAFVPEPAKGFTISAPTFDAVDLGTEFAMSVDTNGDSEIHVIDGSVDVHQKDGTSIRNLVGGDAARQSVGVSELENISIEGDRFVDWREFSEMLGDHSQSRYKEWRRQRSRWINDSDMILYFDFEERSSWVPELVSAKAGHTSGGIVGAQWSTGRWPEKSALEFKRSTDRVRVNVPGEWEAISFAAWIRIDGLDRRHNAIFLADEWNLGEPHWHIGAEGELNFALNSGGRFKTEPLIGPSSLGRWLHVAVTYDPEKELISHFLNGELVGSGPAKSGVPISIGEAEIGNWKAQKKNDDLYELRSFNGRMDELLVLGRAMAPAEIAVHYRAGDPYR